MSAAPDNQATSNSSWVKEVATARDTVQSIGIAVVLAFALRAFLIEAFVIPTGSMAPRLMGEHWRLQCPVCAYEYDYGWVSEVPPRQRATKRPPGQAYCPNCNHNYTDSAGPPTWVDGGDRVLVLKYLNNFRDPQPWDVVVFRNPQNNRENYIKRLVGLPGETIEIIHGDVWVKTGDDAPWAIRRKPPAIQEVMWQIIHDNDYQPTGPDDSPAALSGNYRLSSPVDPSKIPTWVDPRATGLWDRTGDGGRRLAFAGGRGAGLQFVGPRENESLGTVEGLAFLPHYGYNDISAENNTNSNAFFRRELCTDLRLSFVYMPYADDSRVALLLDVMAKGYAAEVGADGTVRLLHRPYASESILTGGDPAELTEETGWTTWQETRIPPLEIGRGYELALTNVDYRLTLWIDGREVLQSTDTQYPADRDEIRALMMEVLRRDGRKRIPTPKVAIAAAGGPSELLHIKLERDVYYTHTNLAVPRGRQWGYARSLPPGRRPPGDDLPDDDRDRPSRRPSAQLSEWGLVDQPVEARTGDPGWGVTGRPIRLRGDPSAPNDLDSFYVLGDNSPQSHDGRRWTQAAPTLRLYQDGQPIYQLGTVPRYNMIGKAVFVYWPSGFRLPGLAWLPLVPNVGSMRMVR